ncbi:Spy/CpxP family protein refolding chaperone [Mucilaginibacter sp. AW1-3]
MDQVLKNRMWGFIVGLLVVANIATLAGFWYIKLHSNKIADLPRGQSNTQKFIIAELGLDASQQRAYEELVQQHRENVGRVQDDLREAKDAFFNSIAHPETSQAEVDTLSAHIAKCERKLDMITYEHFKKVRALCNDTQKTKFDNIIKQVLRMMGPGGGRPQGPPPGRGGDFPPPPPGEGQGPPPGPPQ